MPKPAAGEIKPLALLESRISLVESHADGREWDVVVIASGLSLNRYFYSTDLLRKSVRVFENAAVAAYEFNGKMYDHVPAQARRAVPGGFVKNIVGWIDGCRFDEGRKAIVARFHISENAAWLRQLLKEAFQHGKGELLGFSIDAEGEMRLGTHEGKSCAHVLKLDRANELTVVSTPSAGGRALRLVASIPEAEMPKAILTLMRESFPAKWFEGFDLDGVTDANAKDLLTQVLESNLARAGREYADAQAKGTANIQEVANAVATLQQLNTLLTDGKVQEAMQVIRQWIAALSSPEGGEPAATAESYRYPIHKDPTPAPPAAAPAPTPKPGKTEDDPMSNPDLAKQLAEAKAETAATNARMDRIQTDSALAAVLAESELPQPSKDRVRELFANRTGTTKDVQEAVAKEKDFLAKMLESGSLPAAGARKDVPDATVVAEQREKYGKAMLGMIMGEDIDKVPAFGSLHESYSKVSGYYGPRSAVAKRIMVGMAVSLPPDLPGDGNNDEEFIEHQGKIRESVNIYPVSIREALTTTVWAEVFGDSIRRALQRQFSDPPFAVWRTVVSDVVPLQDMRTNRRIRVGGFGDLPVVGELGTYQEFTNPADQEETYAAQKRGRLWPISWESILADDLGKVRQAPRMLSRAALRTLSKAVLNGELSDNPVLSDAIALIAAGHSNDQAAALTEATLNGAIQQMRLQTELSSGERMFLSPRYLVVPPQLEDTAWELTNSRNKVTVAETSTVDNVIRDHFRITPIVNPWQTSATRWQLVADPRTAPTIEVGFLGNRQQPEIFIQDAANIGSVLTADKITYKIRHVWGAQVLDFRGFAGSAT